MCHVRWSDVLSQSCTHLQYFEFGYLPHSNLQTRKWNLNNIFTYSTKTAMQHYSQHTSDHLTELWNPQRISSASHFSDSWNFTVRDSITDSFYQYENNFRVLLVSFRAGDWSSRLDFPWKRASSLQIIYLLSWCKLTYEGCSRTITSFAIFMSVVCSCAKVTLHIAFLRS